MPRIIKMISEQTYRKKYNLLKDGEVLATGQPLFEVFSMIVAAHGYKWCTRKKTGQSWRELYLVDAANQEIPTGYGIEQGHHHDATIADDSIMLAWIEDNKKANGLKGFEIREARG